MPKSMTRRKFLMVAGTATAGAAFAGIPGAAGNALAAPGTWSYVKLDPEVTAERAYHEFFRVLCGAATISAVFGQLAEKIGEPYASFPVDAFAFLRGGVSGWGTICGAVSGANIVTNLVVGSKPGASLFQSEGALMGNELIGWYCAAEMPIYAPKKPKLPVALPKTVSESPLCHISLGRWMKAADKSVTSPEAAERCARLAGSVAYRLVEHLNAWEDGTYRARTDPQQVALHGIPTQQNCLSCHPGGAPEPPRKKL